MQSESPALIWDATRASGRVVEFVSGRSWADYRQDVMLRSAVERQFQIIGEALNRLSKVDPSTAGRVPDLARIVAFRNVRCTATRRSTTRWSGKSSRPGSRS